MYKKVKEITARLKKDDSLEPSNDTQHLSVSNISTNDDAIFASPLPKKRFVDKFKKFSRDSRDETDSKPQTPTTPNKPLIGRRNQHIVTNLLVPRIDLNSLPATESETYVPSGSRLCRVTFIFC